MRRSSIGMVADSWLGIECMRAGFLLGMFDLSIPNRESTIIRLSPPLYSLKNIMSILQFYYYTIPHIKSHSKDTT
jgi:hypothetical protein